LANPEFPSGFAVLSMGDVRWMVHDWNHGMASESMCLRTFQPNMFGGWNAHRPIATSARSCPSGILDAKDAWTACKHGRKSPDADHWTQIRGCSHTGRLILIHGTLHVRLFSSCPLTGRHAPCALCRTHLQTARGTNRVASLIQLRGKHEVS